MGTVECHFYGSPPFLIFIDNELRGNGGLVDYFSTFYRNINKP